MTADLVARLREVIAFLLGEAPLDGRWYGDEPPRGEGHIAGYGAPYWWRKPLREAASALRSSGEAVEGGRTCCDRAYKDGYDTGKMHVPDKRSPSYDALLLIAQSVCGALARAGVQDCDDPGEAIDVIRERLEQRIAELEAATPASADRQQRERDYFNGWCNAARWAGRDDLVADEGSEAYRRDRDPCLSPPTSTKGG